jgi:hypothetical protein
MSLCTTFKKSGKDDNFANNAACLDSMKISFADIKSYLVNNGQRSGLRNRFEFYRINERKQYGIPYNTSSFKKLSQQKPETSNVQVNADAPAWYIEKDQGSIILSMSDDVLTSQPYGKPMTRYHISLMEDAWKNCSEFHVTIEEISESDNGEYISNIICSSYYELDKLPLTKKINVNPGKYCLGHVLPPGHGIGTFNERPCCIAGNTSEEIKKKSDQYADNFILLIRNIMLSGFDFSSANINPVVNRILGEEQSKKNEIQTGKAAEKARRNAENQRRIQAAKKKRALQSQPQQPQVVPPKPQQPQAIQPQAKQPPKRQRIVCPW